MDGNQLNAGVTPSGSGCQPSASAADASSQSGIPNAAIEQFCADLQSPLEGIVKKFCEQAYETILGDVQFYLGENAVFNIGSKFDAQQREVVTAYKALRAVEEATTLHEARQNAYAARKGSWTEGAAIAYRAEGEACNAHYELIEAAELLLTAIDMQADLGPTEQGLRAAIAKAEGR